LNRYIVWYFVPRYASPRGAYQKETFVDARTIEEAIIAGAETLNVSSKVVRAIETGIHMKEEEFISENPNGCGWTDPFYNQCLRKSNHKGLHTFTVAQFNDEMRRIRISHDSKHRGISNVVKRK
jgi:hypothetical protein